MARRPRTPFDAGVLLCPVLTAWSLYFSIAQPVAIARNADVREGNSPALFTLTWPTLTVA
jgi:hypothetical protein